ncbi:MAG: TetR/AcrR family transcriptional regulator [Polyangia bacterium]
MPATQKLKAHQPFADRSRQRDDKRRAVLKTAMGLFLEVGYHRATLTEIARRLTITKPALYNYFANKEEILVECYRLGFELMNVTMLEIESRGGTGREKLRALMKSYAKHMMSEYGRGLIALDDRELAGRARGRVRADKRRIDQCFQRFIAEGMEDGSIVQGDVKLTAFTLAGALSWISQWYDPRGRWPVEQIADEMTTRLIDGLAAR